MLKKLDTYEVSRLMDIIEADYGKELNFAYIMEGQKLIEVCVWKADSPDSEEYIAKAISGWQAGTVRENHELIEQVLCDLCKKGHIEEGDYILDCDF